MTNAQQHCTSSIVDVEMRYDDFLSIPMFASLRKSRRWEPWR